MGQDRTEYVSLRTDRTWQVVCDRQRMRHIKTTECWLGWMLKLPTKVETIGGETNVRPKLESSALGICVPTAFIQMEMPVSSWAYQNGTQQRSVSLRDWGVINIQVIN